MAEAVGSEERQRLCGH